MSARAFSFSLGTAIVTVPRRVLNKYSQRMKTGLS